METTSTGPVDSATGDEAELSVEVIPPVEELSIEVSPPVAVAVTLLAATITAALAIAIAAGWHPL